MMRLVWHLNAMLNSNNQSLDWILASSELWYDWLYGLTGLRSLSLRHNLLQSAEKLSSLQSAPGGFRPMCPTALRADLCVGLSSKASDGSLRQWLDL